MGFSRREYWKELLCPPPGDLPDPGIKPISLNISLYDLTNSTLHSCFQEEWEWTLWGCLLSQVSVKTEGVTPRAHHYRTILCSGPGPVCSNSQNGVVCWSEVISIHILGNLGNGQIGRTNLVSAQPSNGATCVKRYGSGFETTILDTVLVHVFAAFLGSPKSENRKSMRLFKIIPKLIFKKLRQGSQYEYIILNVFIF